MRRAVLVLAIGALARGTVSAEPPLDVPGTIGALTSPDSAIRREAATRLGTYPAGAAAVPALIEARRDENAEVRDAVEASLRSLAESALVDAAAFLTEASRERSPSARLEVSRTFASLGPAGTTTDLAFALTMLGRNGWTAPFAAGAGPRSARSDLRAGLSWALEANDARARPLAAAALSLCAGVVPKGTASDERADDAERAIAALATKIDDRPKDRDGLSDDDRKALAFLLTGTLGHSPVGGPASIEALRRRAIAAESDRWALRGLARSVPAARDAFGKAATETKTLAYADMKALVDAGAIDVVTPRLRSADVEERLAAAVALIAVPSSQESAVAVLLADGPKERVFVDELPASWLACLAYAPSRAAETIPVLAKRFGSTKDALRDVSPEAVALAWALWRLDASRTTERDYLLGALELPLEFDAADSRALRAVRESVARLAAAGPRLVDVATKALAQLKARPHLLDPVPLLEALAAQGVTAAPAMGAVLDFLGSETRRLSAALTANGISLEARGDARLRAAVQLGDRLTDVVEPAPVLAAVHVLEASATPSQALRVALESLGFVPSDALHVAVARARRVIDARK